MSRIVERKVWVVKVTAKQNGKVFTIGTPVVSVSQKEAENKVWSWKAAYEAVGFEILDVTATEADEVDLEEEIDDFPGLDEEPGDWEVAPDEFERW